MNHVRKIMAKGICKLNIIPLRAEPSGKSELTSQLLFGETYNIVEIKGEWVKVENDSENYSGWLNQNQVYEWNEAKGDKVITHLFPFLIATHEHNQSTIYLLPGSILHQFERNGNLVTFKINQDTYSANLPVEDTRNLNIMDLETYALQFNNAPYLWGGKSMFGVDCSGFTQLLYKLMGMQLPRDSYQQAELGEVVNFINECKTGDLAFFENETGEIGI
jgi:hypothetical protein